MIYHTLNLDHFTKSYFWWQIHALIFKYSRSILTVDWRKVWIDQEGMNREIQKRYQTSFRNIQLSPTF